MNSRDNVVGPVTKKQVQRAAWQALLLSIFGTEVHPCVCSAAAGNTLPQKFKVVDQFLSAGTPAYSLL